MKYFKILILLGVIFSMFITHDQDIYASEEVTITFVLAEDESLAPNDVTIPNAITGIMGNPIINIPVVSSSTHTFLGWYEVVDGEKEYLTKGDIIIEDKTFYGSWRLTTRVIQYELNGGTNHADNPFVTDSVKTTVLENPSREGYTFLGWFINDTKVTQLSDIKKSLTIVEAKWEAISVTMTIDFNNGSNDVSYLYDYDDSYSLTTPTYTGYSFSGWQVSGQPYESTGVIKETSDFTVESTWTANTNTSYVVNTYTENLDGTYDILSESLTGTTDTTVTHNEETRTGFTFNSSLSVTSGSVAGDGTLVLSMYYDRTLYTVIFINHNSQTIETQQVMYLDDAKTPNYSIDGYQVSWNLSELSSISSNKTIQVILTANTYTISFDQSGINNKTVTFNEAIGSLSTPNAPSGKVFNAWKDIDGNIYTETTLYTLTENVTLYAEFVDIREYEYQFKYYFEDTSGNFVLDETKTETLTAEDGAFVSAIELTEVPNGFELSGNLSTGNVSESATLILSVQYQRITYTVTFLDGNGNTLKIEDVKYELDATPPTYSVDGYSVNWSTSDYENITSNTSVTPTLTEIDYTIEYQYLNNNFDDEVTHEGALSGYSIPNDVTLTTPTRNYYNFVGWYKSSDFSGVPITEITQGTTGDIVLYAKWTLKTYDVTFYATGNDSVTVSVEHGSVIPIEDIPTMTIDEDKIAMYWYYTESNIDHEFDLSLPITQAHQFTLLIVDSVTVQYVYNYDNTIENIKQVRGTIHEEPETPTRDGYNFDGWYSNETLTITYTFGEVILENIVLYADWIPIIGEAIYSTPGTYTWTVPDGVTSISVLAIGSSGASSDGNSPFGYGEAGGAGWVNNYSVTPGDTYAVVVGQAFEGEISYFGSETLVAGYGGADGYIDRSSGIRIVHGSGSALYNGDGGMNGQDGSQDGPGKGYDIYNPNLIGSYGSSFDGIVRIVWDIEEVNFPNINIETKSSYITTDAEFNNNSYGDMLIDWDTSENAFYYTSMTYSETKTQSSYYHTYYYYLNSISYIDNTKNTVVIGSERINYDLKQIDDVIVLQASNGDIYVAYNLLSDNQRSSTQRIAIYNSNLELIAKKTIEGNKISNLKMIESEQYVYLVFNDIVSYNTVTTYFQIDKSNRGITIGNENGSNHGESLPITTEYSNIYTIEDSLYIFEKGKLIVADALGHISNAEVNDLKLFSDESVIIKTSNDEVMLLLFNLDSEEIEYYIYDITNYDSYLNYGVITNSNSFNQSELLKSQYVFVIDENLYIDNSQYVISLNNYSLSKSLHEIPYIDIFSDKVIFINGLLYLVYEDNNSLYTVVIVE